MDAYYLLKFCYDLCVMHICTFICVRKFDEFTFFKFYYGLILHLAFGPKCGMIIGIFYVDTLYGVNSYYPFFGTICFLWFGLYAGASLLQEEYMAFYTDNLALDFVLF